jgi:hypothetical protein
MQHGTEFAIHAQSTDKVLPRIPSGKIAAGQAFSLQARVLWIKQVLRILCE